LNVQTGINARLLELAVKLPKDQGDLLREATNEIDRLRSPGMKMTLSRAIYILASVHTRDDDVTGFVIMAGVGWRDYETPFSQQEYNEAWKVLREQSNLQTEPSN
jgi:hypothetical protein